VKKTKQEPSKVCAKRKERVTERHGAAGMQAEPPRTTWKAIPMQAGRHRTPLQAFQNSCLHQPHHRGRRATRLFTAATISVPGIIWCSSGTSAPHCPATSQVATGEEALICLTPGKNEFCCCLHSGFLLKSGIFFGLKATA